MWRVRFKDTLLCVDVVYLFCFVFCSDHHLLLELYISYCLLPFEHYIWLLFSFLTPFLWLFYIVINIYIILIYKHKTISQSSIYNNKVEYHLFSCCHLIILHRAICDTWQVLFIFGSYLHRFIYPKILPPLCIPSMSFVARSFISSKWILIFLRSILLC